MSAFKSQQAGIALIQILILTTVLTLMALHFTQTSKEQVGTATQLRDKVQAQLKLRTLEANVKYALLTRPTNEFREEDRQGNPVSENWNFYSEPFSPFPDTEVVLQDLLGLLSLYRGRHNEYIQDFLLSQGMAEGEAREAIDALNQWQHSSDARLVGAEDIQQARGGFLRHHNELYQFLNAEEKYIQALKKVTSRFPSVFFNPYNAPPEVLRLFVADEIVDVIVENRKNDAISVRDFQRLTQLTDTDIYSYQPGLRFRINLKAEVGDSVATHEGLWYIRPNSKLPVINLK